MCPWCKRLVVGVLQSSISKVNLALLIKPEGNGEHSSVPRWQKSNLPNSESEGHWFTCCTWFALRPLLQLCLGCPMYSGFVPAAAALGSSPSLGPFAACSPQTSCWSKLEIFMGLSEVAIIYEKTINRTSRELSFRSLFLIDSVFLQIE